MIIFFIIIMKFPKPWLRMDWLQSHIWLSASSYTVWLNICAFPHILGSPSSYMTLQPITSEFPHILEKFLFLVYQCRALVCFYAHGRVDKLFQSFGTQISSFSESLNFLWDWSKINNISIYFFLRTYTLIRRIYFILAFAALELISIFWALTLEKQGISTFSDLWIS